jgi:transposase
MGEFGIVVANGTQNMERLLGAARDLPNAACPAPGQLAGQLRDPEERIEKATARIAADEKVDLLVGRLATILDWGRSRPPPLWPRRPARSSSAPHATT